MNKLLIFLTALILFSSFTNKKHEDKAWGFCHATNGSVSYISNVISYPSEDAALGFPNTKIIRTWRLELKEQLGADFNEKDFTLELIYNEGNYNMSYRSKLEAMEGRDYFINKVKGYGREVKNVTLDY
jgi:hypothetical protein